MEREYEQESGPDEEWRAIAGDLGDSDAAAPLSEGRAHLWALVLEARSVPCLLRADEEGMWLLVPDQHLSRARRELRLFEEENRHWPPSPPDSPAVENVMATLAALLLLATFHNITLLDTPLFGHSLPDWTAAGSADAGAIRNGQWWRLLTSLTLHADWAHLLGNLAFGGIVIVSLCREFGSGLAWSLLLSAGALGNMVNAWVQRPEHRSVGASTLVFGAVGILAAANLVRHRQHRHGQWFLPAAAALALLALLGSEGKNTDLGAHLFGLACGMTLGLIAEYQVGKHGLPGRVSNFLLALASVTVVLAAWWRALAFGG